jgi:hypothetical protein
VITARNYAAQAEQGLRFAAERFQMFPGYNQDIPGVRWLVDRIKAATHFALPDEGKIFDDNLRGLQDMEARLPYPAVTLEYFVKDNNDRDPEAPVYSPKRLVYAEEINLNRLPLRFFAPEVADQFRAEGFVGALGIWAAQEAHDIWYPCPIGWLMPMAWDQIAFNPFQDRLIEGIITDGGDGIKIIGRPMLLCPGLVIGLEKQIGLDAALKSLAHDLGLEISAVLNFCEALTCSNVTSTILEPGAPKKNERRISEGKLPFYETKSLTITVPSTGGRGMSDAKGDRNSPRQHLRRGHIRKLADKRIWVNSCVVGSGETGMINKTYKVKNS